jgi:gamma-glutamyltranspeptidase / glutathione hydrolase
MCRNGAIATSQPLATLAGLRTLQDGGSATDAAVTAAAVLNVIEPMSTGIGGDMFALLYDARRKNVTAINGSGRSPSAATYAEIKRRLNGQQFPVLGPLTWMVPGTVDGWVTALHRGGRMTLHEVLLPAIRFAEEGFTVAPQTAATWAGYESILRQQWDSAQTWLVNGDRAPRAGELFRCPRLAATLRAIAEDGRDAFYCGAIAEELVKFFDEAGGLLALDDFAKHTTDIVEPLRATYRGIDVLGCPPNSQGVAALEALSILDGFDVPAMDFGSGELLHLQLEAMKVALVDAYATVADPAGSDATALLETKHVESIRARISAQQSCHAAVTQGDTVYISCVDKEGNAASFINSLYMPWGSGYTAGNTGILMQNRAHCFSLDERSPNVFGPNKRSRHTLSPVLLMSDGRPLMVFGFVGGDMQVQAQVQFVCNVVDFGMNVQEAMDAPRWRYEAANKEVAIERGFSDGATGDLSNRGHHVIGEQGFFGGGQAIFVDREFGTLQAGSDSRRDGCALGY